MKNKKNIAIAISVIVILIGIGVVIYTNIKFKPENDSFSKQMSETLKTTYPTTIYIYGEDIQFEYPVNKVNLEKVDGFLNSGSSDYNMIIINDLNNTVELSDADIEYVYKFIHCEHNYLLCLGKKYNDTWKPEDILDTTMQGNLSQGYYYDGRKLQGMIGIVLESDMSMINDDPCKLGECVFTALDIYFKEISED